MVHLYEGLEINSYIAQESLEQAVKYSTMNFTFWIL